LLSTLNPGIVARRFCTAILALKKTLYKQRAARTAISAQRKLLKSRLVKPGLDVRRLAAAPGFEKLTD